MSYYDDMKQTLRREPTYQELQEAHQRLQAQLAELDEQTLDQMKEILIEMGWKEEPKPLVPVKTCGHLREDSRYCGSIAVKDRDFCPYHLKERARVLRMAQARARRQRLPLQLPPLEDLYAVQVSLGLVVNALLSGQLDKALGGTVLYGLQQAATNLCRPVAVWEESRPFQCDQQLTLPGLEEEFDLPKGIDLNASPEKAFPETGPAAVSEGKVEPAAGAPPLSGSAAGRVGTETVAGAPPLLDWCPTLSPDVGERVGEAGRKEPQSEATEVGGQEEKLG